VAAAGFPQAPGTVRAVLVELEDEAVDEGLPARFDHVVRDTYRAPALGPVAGLDQHADEAAGTGFVGEDAHFVVVKLHVGELGVELGQRFPEGEIESVDGSVSAGRRMLDGAVGPLDHDSRFRGAVAIFVTLFVDYAEADEPEEFLFRFQALSEQQLERRIGSFELEAATLELFYLGQQ
jgi:hypothetical protein